MICAKSLLFAFVALSLMTVAQAAQPTISHNAAVRRHAAMIQARPARRSVAIGDGKMMVQKRQTAEQVAQAAALKKWDDDFHAKNAEWQQAAIAALNAGQTPPTYDQYWDGKNSGSSASTDSSSSTPSASSDSGSSDQSSSAPAQQEQPKQQQQDQTSSTPASSDNKDAGSSQDNSGSQSDECEEDTSSSTPASTSTSQASTAASGAGGAAATGSKSNAAQTNNSGGSSQSTSGHFGGQATYYAPGLGACGWSNGDSDYIVAISASLFDSFGTGNPNKNPACGHKIAASYGGKTITVSVADRCVGCAWGDLDFTPSGFSALADMSKGRLDGLSWSWIGAAP